MKAFRLFFLLVAVISANALFAQNWSLINKNYTYNYKLDVIGQIQSTIFADSLQVDGNDTTFFLNRIISECDTCPSPSVDFYLKNQPQFLLRQVLVSDGVYHFSGPSEFVIKPYALLNESWQFDTALNYMATVTAVGNSLTFNEPDSFKLITLTNGDNIVVSKKFGILQFPSLTNNDIFTLKGIKGPNVGTVVPLFYAFFNFNVGDVFQYETVEGHFGANFIVDHELKKVSILARTYSQGVFTYQARVQTKSWTDAFKSVQVEFTLEDYIDTIVYTDSATHICNAYNQKAIPNFNLIDPASQPDSIMFGQVNCFIDYDDLWVKGMEFSNTPSNNPKQIFYSSQYDDPSLHPDLLTPASYDNFEYRFKSGLGEMVLSWVLPDKDFSRKLIGWVKNGDTIGTVYGDLFYLSMDDMDEKENGLSIFPNPVVENTNIVLHNPGTYIEDIRLYNLHGQLVRDEKGIRSNSFVLSRKDLQPGCYFLHISDNTGKVYRKKLIVAE